MGTGVGLTVLAAVLTMGYLGTGWVVSRQVRRNDQFALLLGDIRNALTRLDTGGSAGSQAAVADVRADVAELRQDHEALESRHNILATSEAILADRVNQHERWHERQHYPGPIHE